MSRTFFLKRILSFAIALFMLLPLMPVFDELSSAAEGLSYSGSLDIKDGNIVVGETTITQGSNTYTYTSGEEITITGTTTSNTITVESGVSANITLSGVNIDVSGVTIGSEGIPAFKIADNSEGNVNITLVGENKLKSGTSCAGLQKNGDYISEDKGKLTIKREGSLEAIGGHRGAGIGGSLVNLNAPNSSSNITIISGTVIATGGTYCAGIGGGDGGSGSYITISGGTVTATGDSNGAGIGGGVSGSGSNITISGGTVIATGNFGGAGIGGGDGGNGSDITISGGEVTATGSNGSAGIGGGNGGSSSSFNFNGGKIILTKDAEIPSGKTFTIGSGATFEIKENVTLTNNGTLINNGNIDNKGAITNNGTITGYDVGGSAEQSYDGSPLDIKNGSIVIGASTVKQGDNTYNYTAGQEIVITGSTTSNTITVESGVSANIKLSGVSIDVSGSSDTAAFKIADDSTGSVNLTLDGENTLKSGENCAGLQKNGNTGSLKITGTGSLFAEGGTGGAGIGGSNGKTGSNITISGGTITATGYGKAQDIGGGFRGNGKNIVISGGSVKAVDGIATIKKTVNSSGEPVYPLALPVGNATSVQIDGTDIQPIKHDEEGNMYIYLTGEVKHEVVFNGGEKKTYFYDTKDFREITKLKISATDGGSLTENTDYTYINGVLTILSGTAVTISNENPELPTVDTVVVGDSVSANITLSGVNIDVSGLSGKPAFKIEDNSSGNVNLTLVGENTLKSGANCAGLQKNGGTGTLTIDGTGSLTAEGGKNSAGIGGGNNAGGSNITINSGMVSAKGGSSGAGIGGGKGGSGSDITISGGVITAEGGSRAQDIGSSTSGSSSNIVISGGSVKTLGNSKIPTPTNGTSDVYPLELTVGDDATSVKIDGKNYPAKHGGDDTICVYLTGESHTVVVTGADGTAETRNIIFEDNKLTELVILIISATNGGTLKEGVDYTYKDGVLTILSGTDVTIKNDNPKAATTDRILVAKDVSANITLAGVNIDLSQITGINADVSAFKIEDNSKGNITITLAEGSQNFLISGGTNAGLQKNGNYISEKDGKLTIKGSGALTAIGGNSGSGGGAGIGGSNRSENAPDGIGYGSNITIIGGTIIAEGGPFASGIGGGQGGNGSYITISGGTVTATGGHSGAGIGGGLNGSGSDFVISGGSVKVDADKGILPISETPTDGSNNEVFLLDFDTFGKPVTIKTATGKGYVVPSAHGDEEHIYVYLPAGSEDNPNLVTIDGHTYKYYHTDPPEWIHNVEDPVITPNGGKFSEPQEVEITCFPADAQIYYTTDGSVPTRDSTPYTGKFTVSLNTTIKAIAVKDGMLDSEVSSAKFTITSSMVEKPVITPDGGRFSGLQTVTITCATDGAKIYYTTDGSDPTTSSQLYSGEFSVTETITVKAIAVKSGMGDSEIAIAEFTKKSSGGSGGGSGGGGGRPPRPIYYIGTISKEVQLGKNAPNTEIATMLDKLSANVLTDSERLKIYDGIDIKIILTVDDAAQTISAADKFKADMAKTLISGFKSGQYLDVNLFKEIGGDREKITETSEPITIELEIPENLRGENREYAAVRVHNGKTTILPDLDKDADTVTIQTDKFSIYSIIYKDPKADDDTSGGSGGGTSGGGTSSDTSDGSTSGDTSGSTSSDTSGGSTSGDTSGSTSSDISDGSTSSDSSNSTSGDTSSSTSGDTSSGTSSDSSGDSDGNTSDEGNTGNPGKNPFTGTSAMTVYVIAIAGSLAAVLVRKSHGKK